MNPKHIILNAEDMAWTCAYTKGVSFKSLRYDPLTKSGAAMIHMCPGSSYPRFRATKGQDIYVIDGEVTVGERHVERGSFAWVPPGAVHEPTTEKGCVLFVSFPGAVEHDGPGLGRR